jgi:hypothetical protein
MGVTPREEEPVDLRLTEMIPETLRGRRGIDNSGAGL